MRWHGKAGLFTIILAALIHLQVFCNACSIAQLPALKDITTLYWIFNDRDLIAEIDIMADHTVTTISIVRHGVRAAIITGGQHQVIAIAYWRTCALMFWYVARDIKALRMCCCTNNTFVLSDMDFFYFTLAILTNKNNGLCRIVIFLRELRWIISILKQMTNVELCDFCCVIDSQIAYQNTLWRHWLYRGYWLYRRDFRVSSLQRRLWRWCYRLYWSYNRLYWCYWIMLHRCCRLAYRFKQCLIDAQIAGLRSINLTVILYIRSRFFVFNIERQLA